MKEALDTNVIEIEKDIKTNSILMWPLDKVEGMPWWLKGEWI